MSNKELVLETKSVNLKLGNLSCTVREPTLREAETYHKSAQEDDDKSPIETLRPFLKKLGLTDEVDKAMTPRHLEQILAELMPTEKK